MWKKHSIVWAQDPQISWSYEVGWFPPATEPNEPNASGRGFGLWLRCLGLLFVAGHWLYRPRQGPLQVQKMWQVQHQQVFYSFPVTRESTSKRQLREFMSCSRVLLGLICLSVFSDVSSGGFFLGGLGRHRWKAGDYGKDDAGRGRCNLVQCLQGFKVHLANTRCIWDVSYKDPHLV